VDNQKTHLKADVIDWLLEESNPSVRYFALTELLNKPIEDTEVVEAKKAIMENSERFWSWSPDTLPNDHPSTKGKLDGYGNYSSDWSWIIPRNAPTGQYTIFMRVYNHLEAGSRPIIAQREEVVNVKLVEQVTASAKKLEIMAPIHSMIVRINKEIPRKTAIHLTVGA